MDATGQERAQRSGATIALHALAKPWVQWPLVAALTLWMRRKRSGPEPWVASILTSLGVVVLRAAARQLHRHRWASGDAAVSSVQAGGSPHHARS